MKTNKQKAQEYCEIYKLKFEDIVNNLFIASTIHSIKAAKTPTTKNYKNWDKLKYRNAEVFQILSDNDIVCIKNNLYGKQNVNTRFIFTSLIMENIEKNIINDLR